MIDNAAFDHLIHWVNDLAGATTSYSSLGLPANEVLTMPGFRNAAWGIDDERYLELATVDDWDAVTTSHYAEGIEILKPAIDALSGPGLLTFAVDVPDARNVADRLRADGRDVAITEVWFDERNAGFVEVFVRDAPTYFPFFITYSPPRAEIGRMRAAHRATTGITLDGAPDLAALLIGSDNPDAEARLLGDFLNCPTDGPVVDLPGAQVRFSKDIPAGLYGIAVRGSAIERETTVAGVLIVEEG